MVMIGRTFESASLQRFLDSKKTGVTHIHQQDMEAIFWIGYGVWIVKVLQNHTTVAVTAAGQISPRFDSQIWKNLSYTE